MEGNERPQSEFNMAIYTLGRLNYSLYVCSEHFRNMDLWALFHEMVNLYMEVSTEMKGDLIKVATSGERKDNKKHSKTSKDELEEMEKFIAELEPLVERYNDRRQNATGLNKELYTKLRYMNMLLRKIMKDSGLLLKMKDDAAFALGGG
ncbi:hypothetical protein LCGC14_2474710 [marine sediment metagenome]|uniref:Uncharacterized protein n=1 Tax=marine sediment metagenome TaxID=412755 RepID=A0A0F9B983_9ZZZZ